MAAGKPAASKRFTWTVAFATVHVVWGSTYLGIKIALNDGLAPAVLGGARSLIAGCLLLALGTVRGTSLRISRRDPSASAIVGMCLLVGGMYSTMLAEQRADSSLAALVVAAAPLWMAAAEAVAPGMERPSRRGVVGLAVGLVGLAQLAGPRIGGASGTPAELIGIAIQMVGTWLWVGGSIVSRKRPLSTDGTVATGYEMLIADSSSA